MLDILFVGLGKCECVGGGILDVLFLLVFVFAQRTALS